jgi:8-oxo-dGTP pyrophosphatase MutT (NUDIX family)
METARSIAATTIRVGTIDKREEFSVKPDQVGALCIRQPEKGFCQVLLVTSRDTGRWIIPKGWRAKGLTDSQAAAREAAEEAGVSGKVKSKPIGSYTYPKLDRTGARSLRVAVFLLKVRRESAQWAEQHQRTRAWFDIDEAANKVGETALRALIHGIEELTA